MSNNEERVSMVRRDILYDMPIGTVVNVFQYLTVTNLVSIMFNESWDIYSQYASEELSARGHLMTPKKKIVPDSGVSPSDIFVNDIYFSADDDAE
jgi:hypothetical protein